MVPKMKNEDDPSPESDTLTYQLILDATVKHICSITSQHAPESAGKDFLLWLLASDNIHYQDYLQISGIKKMAELGSFWLKDLFDQKTIFHLVDYLGALNAYFFFEVISDNLAIGLARPLSEDIHSKNRKEILLHFNTVIKEKLSGSDEQSLILLNPMSDEIHAISCFEQSLTSSEIKKFADSFLKIHQQWSWQDIDHSAMTFLVLNIESCFYCLNLFPKNSPVYSFLQNSLNSRYASVNSLLQMTTTIEITTLVSWGLYSILVVPTLFYLIGAFINLTAHEHSSLIFDDQTLLKTLECAALLIRLLNDLGTHLLLMSEKDLNSLHDKLHSSMTELSYPNKNTFEVLEILSNQKDTQVLFSRIRKDLEYHEFNVCLDNLSTHANQKDGLKQLFENIKFCAFLYQKERENFENLLAMIASLTQSKQISQLIMKMVVFHEKLYAQEFEHSQGEYAIRR